MNLVIVDADSKNSYASEDIFSLLGISDVTIWNLDDQKLANENYLLEAATGIPGGFSRVVLLTKASHGIMNYHKKMIRSNPSIKYWIVTLPDTTYVAEKKQILSEISEMFQRQNIRYAVLFDDQNTLKDTALMLKEAVPEKPQCVLFFSTETPTVSFIIQTLKISYQDWDVLLNPDNMDWVEKYADKILLFADDLINFKSLAKINNQDRIFTWVEAELGSISQEKEKIVKNTSRLMDECGFSLTREDTHILCGFSQYELFCAEIEAEAYSYTALRNNDAFVMWDEYGLPLLNKQYEDTNMKQFLAEHCVLADFIGIERGAK